MKCIRVMAAAFVAMTTLVVAGPADATDFYELQLYTVATEPQGQLLAELHSNSITHAYSRNTELPLYQIHNTLEFTYGVLPWLEVGQYLCTARLDTGVYEYAGARSKVHFGVPQSESWPIAIGANIEFQYMRREAVDDPLNVEFMPIIQGTVKGFFVVANLAFEKQFSGPGTHAGIGFEPAGEIAYRLPGIMHWLEPTLEYYGEIGPIEHPLPINQQQQFIVPAVNLYTLEPLEFNFGVGFGVTRAWRGNFVKGTIGWSF
ncbi:MAG: hypothetical protein ACREQ4_15535 [Candidatus Binataceae bacterium]